MKPRNPHALPARQRKAGPMKHKNEPRGGERQAKWRELAAEVDPETVEQIRRTVDDSIEILRGLE